MNIHTMLLPNMLVKRQTVHNVEQLNIAQLPVRLLHGSPIGKPSNDAQRFREAL